jgi:hypothetical protein
VQDAPRAPAHEPVALSVPKAPPRAAPKAAPKPAKQVASSAKPGAAHHAPPKR